MGSGSNPAQADSRMLREMRHSADTLNPNQRMDVVWSSRNLSQNLVGNPATLKPIKCRQRHFWYTICSNWVDIGEIANNLSCKCSKCQYYTESFVEEPFSKNLINAMLKVSLPSWPSSSCRTFCPTEILMLLFFLKNHLHSVSPSSEEAIGNRSLFFAFPPSVLRKAAASNKPALRLD